MKQSLTATLAVVFAFAIAPARADDMALAKACLDAERPNRVAACTAAIDAGSRQPRLLAVSHVIRGMAYGDDKQYDRALADFDAAVDLAPSLSLGFSARGDYYLDQHEPERALEDFERAVRLESGSFSARYGRARAYSALHQYEKAIADFDNLIEREPATWTLMDRGKAYAGLGKLDRAIADYDEAIRLKPDNAEALYLRGQAKLRAGDTAGGNADIASAQSIDPKIAETAGVNL